MFICLSGCVSKNTKCFININKIKLITNYENVQISLKATSKFNFPGMTTTWNAFTWVSRWGQLMKATFLGCRQHLWPGTTKWPPTKKSNLRTPKRWILKKKNYIDSRSIPVMLICGTSQTVWATTKALLNYSRRCMTLKSQLVRFFIGLTRLWALLLPSTRNWEILRLSWRWKKWWRLPGWPWGWHQ